MNPPPPTDRILVAWLTQERKYILQCLNGSARDTLRASQTVVPISLSHMCTWGFPKQMVRYKWNGTQLFALFGNTHMLLTCGTHSSVGPLKLSATGPPLRQIFQSPIDRAHLTYGTLDQGLLPVQHAKAEN